jgi:ankyrin repeat protein
LQTPSAPKQLSKEQARKTLIAWLRALIIFLLLAPPAWLVIQAGRQIDLNRNLLLAIRRNDANTVEFLLSAGAEANARDSPQDARPMPRQILDRIRGIPVPPGNSALLVHLGYVRDKNKPSAPWIALPENTAIARALLDHHADPNARGDHKTTPLIMAVQQEKEATIQALLRGGAKVNLRDSQGIDALHFAAEHGTAHIARLLLDAGADINSRDGLVHITPLMEAMAHTNEPVITLLKAAGAK